ncbi:MAG: SRPBCC domain-containing protein [Phycisphaerales bacterium]|nr:SRPBCC domain-containing protein [Phycisphaerales bacterium]
MPIPSTPDRILWRIHLASPPKAVYELIATDTGRARFWAESAVERDGAIDFVFINGMRNRSQILKRTPPHHFELDYFNSRVVFELAPDSKGGTDLTLTNTGVDPEEWDEVLPGWLNVLFPLKAAVDFDIDLRNHDAARTWEQGYVDQ